MFIYKKDTLLLQMHVSTWYIGILDPVRGRRNMLATKGTNLDPHRVLCAWRGGADASRATWSQLVLGPSREMYIVWIERTNGTDPKRWFIWTPT